MNKYSPTHVQAYYEASTDSYLRHYGDVIQAFRPTNTDSLLDYVGRSAGINWKLSVLDLGCGVAGPAIHFAKRWNATVTGVTIAPKQFKIGNEKINQENVGNNVHLFLGDYHQLDNLPIENDTYDVTLFLESLGHSNNIHLALENAYKKTAKNGRLYIKDFFKRKSANVIEQQQIDKVIENINKNYCYNTLAYEETIQALEQTGWKNITVSTFDFMDDVSVRFNFEQENKIDIFENIPEFYPADWLEIKAVKS